MPRFVYYLIGIPLLFIVAAALLVPVLVDEQRLLTMAQTAVREQSGAELAVAGELQLSFFPVLGVQLGDASLTMADEAEPMLHADGIDIGVQFMPLLSGALEIGQVALDGVTVNLSATPTDEVAIKNEALSDAQLEARYEQLRLEREAAGVAASAESVLAVPMALNVARLSLTNSQVNLRDANGVEQTTVQITKLVATGLNLQGEAIPLELELHLLRPEGEPPVTLSAQGEVRADTDSQALRLEGISVAISGATSEPLKVAVTGDYDLNRRIADLQIQLSLGEMHGEGKLRYAAFESPEIDAKLRLNLLDPALLALAGPDAAQASTTSTGKGDNGASTGDSPLPLEPLRAIDSRAHLTVAQAHFGVHVVQDMILQVRAVEGVVTIGSLKGSLHGGLIDARGTFNARHNKAQLNTRGTLTGMDIDSLLTALESATMVTGKGTLDWQLAGAGHTANELIDGLRGPANLTTEQVVLEGMSIEKTLCEAVALVNQESLTNELPGNSHFEALSAHLKFADGKVVLAPLRAELAQLKLSGDGQLDLQSEQFKAGFNATLSPALAELDPACRVNKRLTDIEWPVKCKGSLADEPAKWCGVDVEEIVADMARNEVQRKVKKEASRLFDKLLKN